MNVERFLRHIRLPRWSLFDRHIGIRSHQTLLSPNYSPFDFRGVLLVDNDVELQEGDELTQLFREDLRQVLGFRAQRKGLAEAKHSFIASPFRSRWNVGTSAHLVFAASLAVSTVDVLALFRFSRLRVRSLSVDPFPDVRRTVSESDAVAFAECQDCDGLAINQTDVPEVDINCTGFLLERGTKNVHVFISNPPT